MLSNFDFYVVHVMSLAVCESLMVNCSEYGLQVNGSVQIILHTQRHCEYIYIVNMNIMPVQLKFSRAPLWVACFFGVNLKIILTNK